MHALLALSLLLGQTDDGSEPFDCALPGLAGGSVVVGGNGAITLLDGKRPVAHGTWSPPGSQGTAEENGLNLAKLNVECRNGRISVSCQKPFSAFTLTMNTGRLE
jgi:hypothetical protein